MKNIKWLTVPEYASIIKKSRAQIYLDIRTGKISKQSIRHKAVKKVLQIKYPDLPIDK